MATTEKIAAMHRLQDQGLKVCTLCKETKPLSEFNFILRKGVKRPCWHCRSCEAVNYQNKRGTEKMRQKTLRANRLRQERFPEKRRAVAIVAKALRSGELVRPSTCSECGEAPPPFPTGKAAIEGHHPDYSRPLHVVWLCQKCHTKQHREQVQNEQ